MARRGQTITPIMRVVLPWVSAASVAIEARTTGAIARVSPQRVVGLQRAERWAAPRAATYLPYCRLCSLGAIQDVASSAVVGQLQSPSADKRQETGDLPQSRRLLGLTWQYRIRTLGGARRYRCGIRSIPTFRASCSPTSSQSRSCESRLSHNSPQRQVRVKGPA